jgi:hypothetical protein
VLKNLTVPAVRMWVSLPDGRDETGP